MKDILKDCIVFFGQQIVCEEFEKRSRFIGHGLASYAYSNRVMEEQTHQTDAIAARMKHQSQAEDRKSERR